MAVTNISDSPRGRSAPDPAERERQIRDDEPYYSGDDCAERDRSVLRGLPTFTVATDPGEKARDVLDSAGERVLVLLGLGCSRVEYPHGLLIACVNHVHVEHRG